MKTKPQFFTFLLLLTLFFSPFRALAAAMGEVAQPLPEPPDVPPADSCQANSPESMASRFAALADIRVGGNKDKIRQEFSTSLEAALTKNPDRLSSLQCLLKKPVGMVVAEGKDLQGLLSQALGYARRTVPGLTAATFYDISRQTICSKWPEVVVGWVDLITRLLNGMWHATIHCKNLEKKAASEEIHVLAQPYLDKSEQDTFDQALKAGLKRIEEDIPALIAKQEEGFLSEGEKRELKKYQRAAYGFRDTVSQILLEGESGKQLYHFFKRANADQKVKWTAELEGSTVNFWDCEKPVESAVTTTVCYATFASPSDSLVDLKALLSYLQFEMNSVRRAFAHNEERTRTELDAIFMGQLPMKIRRALFPELQKYHIKRQDLSYVSSFACR